MSHPQKQEFGILLELSFFQNSRDHSNHGHWEFFNTTHPGLWQWQKM